MSSSLYKSPLRNSNSDVKLSLPSPQDSIPNLEFPKVNQNNSEKEPQSLEKIKNPLDNFISETKKFLWNSPKALEASYYLTATAITTLFLSPYQSLITGKSLAETRNEILQTVVEKGRNWCNKHLWCGSLLGKDEEFIKASDTTLQDNLNPFTWVGNSFISSLMYTVDWSRAESTRAAYNLINKKNISAEEFKTLEETDAVLHSLRVSSDLIKAGLSLILLKKLGPSEMRAWQPLIISSGMSLANAVGEKWQNNKTCLDIEVAEHTLSGVANSLLFMGTMRAGSKLYTNHGGKVFSLFGATSIDKNILSAHAKHVTEFYDLRDSIPDLVNTLHKARKELWDRDTDKKLNTWLIAGHILTVGSALTDTAELKMLDKLSATSEKHLNNQVHATKDRRKTTQSKTDAQLLDDEFEKLCKMGEATKGKVTAEIMSHTYDVLIKTAEYWQKNGVKFNF